MTIYEFEQLFDRFHRPIYSFFKRRGFASEDCRELTQETFLAAYESGDRFRGESKTSTWLFAIAKNVWRRTVRDKSRGKRKGETISLGVLNDEDQASAVLGSRQEGSESPLERVLEGEKSRVLYRALEELPDELYACSQLRLAQGLSYREIAIVLDLSIDRVKYQLFQARAKLRKQLIAHFEETET